MYIDNFDYIIIATYNNMAAWMAQLRRSAALFACRTNLLT